MPTFCRKLGKAAGRREVRFNKKHTPRFPILRQKNRPGRMGSFPCPTAGPMRGFLSKLDFSWPPLCMGTFVTWARPPGRRQAVSVAPTSPKRTWFLSRRLLLFLSFPTTGTPPSYFTCHPSGLSFHSLRRKNMSRNQRPGILGSRNLHRTHRFFYYKPSTGPGTFAFQCQHSFQVCGAFLRMSVIPSEGVPDWAFLHSIVGSLLRMAGVCL